MSDLERAVDARIASYRPDLVPPFETIRARRRRRSASRAAGGALLCALGVAGIAFGASAVGGGPDRLPAPFAGAPDQAQTTYVLRYAEGHPYVAAAAEPAAEACTGLPGVSEVGVEQTLPPAYVVTIGGTTDQADAFAACVAALPGVTVGVLPAVGRAAAAPADVVDAPVLHDPTTAPSDFSDRPALPSCGSYALDQGGEQPAAGFACLAESVGSADGAELAVQAPSIEGMLSVYYYRALPAGTGVEFYADATRDPMSDRSWSRGSCAGVDRQTGPLGCETVEVFPLDPAPRGSAEYEPEPSAESTEAPRHEQCLGTAEDPPACRPGHGDPFLDD